MIKAIIIVMNLSLQMIQVVKLFQYTISFIIHEENSIYQIMKEVISI